MQLSNSTTSIDLCYLQVSSNGFISLGALPSTSPPTIPGSTNIVSPYGADIDTGIAGTVRYTGFLTNHPEINTISYFISIKKRLYFTGTRMMVAEWDGVAKSGGTSVRFCLWCYFCRLCYLQYFSYPCFVLSASIKNLNFTEICDAFLYF